MRAVRLVIFAIITVVLCCYIAVAEQREKPGLGQVAEAKQEVTIRNDDTKPMWQFPSGHSVKEDSVEVWCGAKQWARFDGESPLAETYRMLYGKALLFNPGDAGRQVSVRYRYRPIRLALAEPINLSDLDYQGSYLEKTLLERLYERRFEVVLPDEVRLAATSLRISFGPAIEGDGTSLDAEKMTKLADLLGVTYVLISGIGNTQSDAQAITRRMVASRITIRLYDSETGSLLFGSSRSASEKQLKGILGLGQSSRKARESLIRVSVAELLADYFGNAD